MNWTNVIILAAVALIVGLGILYILRAKKRGVRCIGCPEGVKCSGQCAGCSGQCSGCNHGD